MFSPPTSRFREGDYRILFEAAGAAGEAAFMLIFCSKDTLEDALAWTRRKQGRD